MALIYPTDRDDAERLARQLLDAASAERHDEVRTTTDGALGLAFEVPDDLADLVLGTGDSRVVQPSLSAPVEVGGESLSAVAGVDVPDIAGGESVSADARVDVPDVPDEAGGKSGSAVVGADVPGGESVSAVAGADVSEVDAEPVDRSSQPPVKAARSRSSRSR
ncbi:hypothetical protein HCA58_05055 [Micromonospora sp. HNM0581]|uniref:hypothetical protein n=1 Tax=Micromonospora sp. HNM0581 TaxID=2716341 RepID=UPI00146F01AA|nr:hypothetical protein [Micromonospora sp. HNM0581]NLU77773.1 hypothetical protein [Micromonospora sp. HNM0581]